MGWTASYQVVRETPLAPHEIVQLAALVRRHRKRAWDGEPFHLRVATTPRADRVIADGMNKLSMSRGSQDTELLKAAVGELHALLGGELRIGDDFGVLGRTPRPLEVPWGELVDVTTLVAPPPVELAASDGIAELIAKLVEITDDAQQKPVEERLAQQDGLALARLIYRDYAVLGRNHGVRTVLSAALDRVADPAMLVPEFLEVWRHPAGTYFYGDLPLPQRFAAAIARDPRVHEQLVADIAVALSEPSDRACRCANVALDLLAAGGHTRDVVSTIRQLRGRSLSFDQRGVFERAHQVLARTSDARVVATLLRFVGTARSFGMAARVVDGLVKLAPDRIRPHVTALARRGVHRRQCIGWLGTLGDPEGLVPALVARGSLPIEQRAIDVDLETRHDALREIHRRRDPATYVSLVLAELLDKFLRARTDFPGLPFSWHEWKDLLPPGDAKEGTSARKLKWYELVGKNLLGAQVIWPSVERILQRGGEAIAAEYPAELIELDAETLAALDREEATAFGF